MLANPSNFQVMLLVIKNDDNDFLAIGNVSTDAANSVKLLGITIDLKLKFNQHLTSWFIIILFKYVINNYL